MITRKKLDVSIEYEDVDTGPYHCNRLVTHLKDRYHHRRNSFLHQDFLYEKRLLQGSIGKNWDDIYSKFCLRYDARTFIGNYMRRSIWRTGHDNLSFRSYTHFYIDSNGNLQRYVRPEYIQPTKPVEKINWYGDVYFERVKCSELGKCGCVHFKHRPPAKTTRYWETGPYNCIHGNEPLERYRWEVVTYKYRYPDPNDVNRTIYYHALSPITNAKYGLKEQGDKCVMLNKDVLGFCEKPTISTKRKTPNKKELRLIRENGGIV